VYLLRRKSSTYYMIVSGTRFFRRLWVNLIYNTLLKAPAMSKLSINTTRGLFLAQIIYTYFISRSSVMSVERYPLTFIYVPRRSVYFLLKKYRRLTTINFSALLRVFSSAIGL
jgi:hypothetical protein